MVKDADWFGSPLGVSYGAVAQVSLKCGFESHSRYLLM